MKARTAKVQYIKENVEGTDFKEIALLSDDELDFVVQKTMADKIESLEARVKKLEAFEGKFKQLDIPVQMMESRASGKSHNDELAKVLHKDDERPTLEAVKGLPDDAEFGQYFRLLESSIPENEEYIGKTFKYIGIDPIPSLVGTKEKAYKKAGFLDHRGLLVDILGYKALVWERVDGHEVKSTRGDSLVENKVEVSDESIGENLIAGTGHFKPSKSILSKMDWQKEMQGKTAIFDEIHHYMVGLIIVPLDKSLAPDPYIIQSVNEEEGYIETKHKSNRVVGKVRSITKHKLKVIGYVDHNCDEVITQDFER